MADWEPIASIASRNAEALTDAGSAFDEEILPPMTHDYSQSHRRSIPKSNPVGIANGLIASRVTVTATRLAEAMTKADEDQSSLARAIGITQGAISKILQGKTANSRHLPRIAHHLGVSLSWLLGETTDQAVTLTTPAAPSINLVTMQVALPSEAALTRMFLGMLKTSRSAKTEDEQAQLLAKRLPIALSQLRDLLPETTVSDLDPVERPVALATHHPGSRQ
jgi:transcriptional regulator with XRE-family HTH domain